MTNKPKEIKWVEVEYPTPDLPLNQVNEDLRATKCHNCTSHSLSCGYPQLKGKHLSRIIYTENYGIIPEGLLVRHKCDNRLCINPAHLELGTHQDNVTDCIVRNRRNDQRTKKPNRYGWNGFSKVRNENYQQNPVFKKLLIAIKEISTQHPEYTTSNIYTILNNIKGKDLLDNI